MLNEEENRYLEKWTYVQKTQQFQRRAIFILLILCGLFSLLAISVGQNKPIIVQKEAELFRSLKVDKSDLKPTKASVAELISEFIKIRYEWTNFDPQSIVKNLEPLTTEAFRSKQLDEFGKKGFQNKPGDSVEQTVSRVRPAVSEKEVFASFDRILRINNIPVVVPTEISVMLSEGPKTYFNPIGLYINGMIEH